MYREPSMKIRSLFAAMIPHSTGRRASAAEVHGKDQGNRAAPRHGMGRNSQPEDV